MGDYYLVFPSAVAVSRHHRSVSLFLRSDVRR